MVENLATALATLGEKIQQQTNYIAYLEKELADAKKRIDELEKF